MNVEGNLSLNEICISHGLHSFPWVHSIQDTSVAVELRTAIGDLQTRQEEDPAASCCISFEFKRHTQ